MRTRSPRHRGRASQREARPCAGMRQVNRHAAGGDIGAQAIMVCVPDGDDQQRVRAFGTDTADRDPVADWCMDCGIQMAAMASTGGE